MFLKKIIQFFLLFIPLTLWSSHVGDSIPEQILTPFIISGYQTQVNGVSRLGAVHQNFIVSGKKNEVINLKALNANVAEKTGRQVFARVPGAFVYDMDGSGNQINMATRGLDPHRSWEFNIRQNGVMINSDIYGYPASHYSMPLEAVSQVELIRGTASLQYGASFGGMINYVIKEPDTSKTFGYEGFHTIGSFGLRSQYHQIGGKTGKLTYQAYYHTRESDGYREGAASTSDNQYVRLRYNFTDRFFLQAELGRSTYLFHNPGPLTDQMFAENPRQATRARNYFNPDIYVPSIKAVWKISDQTEIDWTVSAVLGDRRSVLFDAFANVADTIDPVTGQFRNRIVDIDQFNSYTSELRILHRYRLAGINQTLTAGVRYIHNDLKRKQQGRGTTGTDADFSIIAPFNRDLNFATRNIAFFAEQKIDLTERLSISPGFRIEHGSSKMTGIIRYLDVADVPVQIDHSFPLFGISGEYALGDGMKLYGGCSQAYRPVLFKDIIPGSVLERTNPDIQNALGYNAEFGFSGRLGKRINVDITAFYMRVNNRLGNLVDTDAEGNSIILKSNIGDAVTRGIELYAQYLVFENDHSSVSFFSSTSFMNGTYQNAAIRQGGENISVSGNQIESVPHIISRNGADIIFKKWSLQALVSYTDESFSDPANTVAPSANGAVGLVPGYTLVDLGIGYKFSKHIQLRATANNLLDKSYFTKRPLIYPGAGVWPSDGRSFQVSVLLSI